VDLPKAGDEDVAKYVCKIGHNLHGESEPVFSKVCYSSQLQAVYRSLGYKHPVVPQSMYIFKNPRVGGAVNPHQDSTFIYTDPLSCVGAWFALADCSKENGCLWATPGSHSIGISRRFLRNAEGTSTHFEPSAPQELPTEGAVPLECPAGTLVLIHGSVVHFSEQNTSDKARPAFTMHVIEGDNEYPPDNWLQRDSPFPELYTSD
jgi:phytanoyl-CoA hydroxylase